MPQRRFNLASRGGWVLCRQGLPPGVAERAPEAGSTQRMESTSSSSHIDPAIALVLKAVAEDEEANRAREQANSARVLEELKHMVETSVQNTSVEQPMTKKMPKSKTSVVAQPIAKKMPTYKQPIAKKMPKSKASVVAQPMPKKMPKTSVVVQPVAKKPAMA